MQSLTFDCIHGQTTLGMAMPSFLFGTTQGRTTSVVTMPSSHLDCTHNQETLGMACHHGSLKAYTIGRRWEWYVIIALGQHTRSNDLRHHTRSDDIGRKIAIIILGQNTQSDDISVAGHHRPWTAYARSDNVGCGMQSSPLYIIQDWTKSGLASHHFPWKANMIVRHRP